MVKNNTIPRTPKKATKKTVKPENATIGHFEFLENKIIGSEKAFSAQLEAFNKTIEERSNTSTELLKNLMDQFDLMQKKINFRFTVLDKEISHLTAHLNEVDSAVSSLVKAKSLVEKVVNEPVKKDIAIESKEKDEIIRELVEALDECCIYIDSAVRLAKEGGNTSPEVIEMALSRKLAFKRLVKWYKKL
jgi:hypothetical protein